MCTCVDGTKSLQISPPLNHMNSLTLTFDATIFFFHFDISSIFNNNKSKTFFSSHRIKRNKIFDEKYLEFLAIFLNHTCSSTKLDRGTMEKLVLCRLCLTNSSNTSFVSVTPEIELILQKYKIVFEVSKRNEWFPFFVPFENLPEKFKLSNPMPCPATHKIRLHSFLCLFFPSVFLFIFVHLETGFKQCHCYHRIHFQHCQFN